MGLFQLHMICNTLSQQDIGSQTQWVYHTGRTQPMCSFVTLFWDEETEFCQGSSLVYTVLRGIKLGGYRGRAF